MDCMKVIIFLLLAAVMLLQGHAFPADSDDINYIRDFYKKVSDRAASGVFTLRNTTRSTTLFP